MEEATDGRQKEKERKTQQRRTFWKGVFSAPIRSNSQRECPPSHVKFHTHSLFLEACKGYWSSSSCSQPVLMVSPVPWAELSWLYKEAGNSAKNAFGGRVAFCCIWNRLVLLSFSLIFSPFDGCLQLERIQNQFQCRCKES